MNGTNTAKLAEIDSNLEQFLELLPNLIDEHLNDYVLMRHRKIVGYYDSAIDAQIAGNQRFEDSIFSIQPIRQVAEELGNFAYAVHPRGA